MVISRNPQEGNQSLANAILSITIGSDAPARIAPFLTSAVDVGESTLPISVRTRVLQRRKGQEQNLRNREQ